MTIASYCLSIAGALLLLAGSASATTVYRCDGPEGTVYADTPCGDEAEVLELTPSFQGGRRDQGLERYTVPPRPAAPVEAEPPAEPDSACRTFQSTTLRSHLIREEVVPGMTRAHVREAWGAPIDAFAGPVEMWTYDNTYYGRLISVTRVYFEDGCVTDVDVVEP